jgi:hypothetical protein
MSEMQRIDSLLSGLKSEGAVVVKRTTTTKTFVASGTANRIGKVPGKIKKIGFKIPSDLLKSILFYLLTP